MGMMLFRFDKTSYLTFMITERQTAPGTAQSVILFLKCLHQSKIFVLIVMSLNQTSYRNEL